MGLGEGIRECVADVGVQTADINSAAVTTAKIADANVTTAKIADGNVTADKIAVAVAKTVGKVVGSTAGTTVAETWVCTSACTVLSVVLQITAAMSVDGTVLVQNTAASAIVLPSRSATAAGTLRTETATALEAAVPVVELTAGQGLEVTASGNTDKLKGKLFVTYIATPS